MSHAAHPMTQTALKALVRGADGHLDLDDAGAARVRAALAASGEDLGEALLALVEIAFVVERDGHPRLAEKLRALASEQTGRFDGHVRRVRHCVEDRQRAGRRRFEHFTGATAARAAAPRSGASVRVSDLAPPRPIHAR